MNRHKRSDLRGQINVLFFFCNKNQKKKKDLHGDDETQNKYSKTSQAIGPFRKIMTIYLE